MRLSRTCLMTCHKQSKMPLIKILKMAKRSLWVLTNKVIIIIIIIIWIQNNRVWLECDGENPADRENIGGITYYPTNGVSANFYPYLNQKGYLSPVVFAHLDNPRRKMILNHNIGCLTFLSDGVLIAVECKAWAKNIQHDSQERKGLVHFEVQSNQIFIINNKTIFL